MKYPINIIAAYRGGNLPRRRFIQQFGDWQKSCGVDYDCRSSIGKQLHLTYRGVTATILGGVICFEVNGNSETAATPFKFRRKVDFAIREKIREVE